MNTVAVVACFVGILLLDLPTLVSRKMKKETVAFCVLFVVAFVFCVVLSLGVHVPSILMGLTYLLEHIPFLHY